MKSNHQTATTYVPATAPGTPFPGASAAPNVVNADNRPSGAGILLLAFSVLFIVGGLFAWAVQSLTGWSLAAVSIVLLPIIAVLGFVLFLAANGDWIAWREIVSKFKIRRDEIREHADLLRTNEAHRHAEAMRQLDIQEQQVRLGGEVQALRFEVDSLSRKLLTAHPTHPSTTQFVHADPDKARAQTIALGYLLSLYLDRRTRGAGR